MAPRAVIPHAGIFQNIGVSSATWRMGARAGMALRLLSEGAGDTKHVSSAPHTQPVHPLSPLTCLGSEQWGRCLAQSSWDHSLQTVTKRDSADLRVIQFVSTDQLPCAVRAADKTPASMSPHCGGGRWSGNEITACGVDGRLGRDRGTAGVRAPSHPLGTRRHPAREAGVRSQPTAPEPRAFGQRKQKHGSPAAQPLQEPGGGPAWWGATLMAQNSPVLALLLDDQLSGGRHPPTLRGEAAPPGT